MSPYSSSSNTRLVQKLDHRKSYEEKTGLKVNLSVSLYPSIFQHRLIHSRVAIYIPLLQLIVFYIINNITYFTIGCSNQAFLLDKNNSMGAHIEYTVIVLGDGHQGFAADKSA